MLIKTNIYENLNFILPLRTPSILSEHAKLKQNLYLEVLLNFIDDLDRITRGIPLSTRTSDNFSALFANQNRL